MNNSNSIGVSALGKCYKFYRRPVDKLQEIAFRRKFGEEHWALRDVSFEVLRGERIGIIGANGSGKSTLLKIISGVLSPSEGVVQVSGRVSALLELGIGFNGELSGRENVLQYGLIQGLSKSEVLNRFREIADFAELGEGLEHPIRTYSSGMLVRLAFSCAVFTDPDILIVDEALSVGDAYFQAKCVHKIRSLLDRGVTFLYVSHSPESVRSLCSRALLLESGRVALDGDSDEVAREYERRTFIRTTSTNWGRADLTEANAISGGHAILEAEAAQEHSRQAKMHDMFDQRVAAMRAGNGSARVRDVYIENEAGERIDNVAVGQSIRICATVDCASDVLPENSAVCIGVCDRLGNTVVHFNSLDKDVDLAQITDRRRVTLRFGWNCNLCPGQYSIIIGVAQMMRDGLNPAFWITKTLFDYCVGGLSFVIPIASARSSLWGLVAADYSVQT